MASTTITTAAATRRPTAARAVVRNGLVAGVAAAAAATVIAYAAKALGVPMMAAPQTASAAEPLPMGAFAFSVLANTAVGVVLALALLRWAQRPARTFVVTALVLTAISFAGPITTGHATTATRLVLALTHVVVAALVIPAIAAALPAHGRR